jgi:hypothetical protein
MSFITQEEALRRLTSEDNLALSALSAPSVKDIPPSPTNSVNSDAGPTETEQTSEVVYTDSAAAAQLNPDVKLPEIVHEPLHKGRKGVKNLPPMLRTIIGVAARSHTARIASDAFGVSPSHAAGLANGMIDGRNIDPALKAEIDEASRSVSDVVLDLLLQTMGTISPEKIAGIKSVREAAGIGKDLASIHQVMKDKKDAERTARVIIMAPHEYDVDAYEIKDVSENPL